MIQVIEQNYDFVPVSMKMDSLHDVELMHDALFRYAMKSKYSEQNSVIDKSELSSVIDKLEKIINRSGGRLYLI